MGTLANIEDPDKMLHKAAFHVSGSAQILFSKIISIYYLRTQRTSFYRNFDWHSLKYKKDNSILIVSIVNPIRKKRVKWLAP